MRTIPRKIILLCIAWYRRALAPLFVHSCAFTPTCSVYASQCIERHGVIRGGYYAFRRILRCHPWQKYQVDLPPSK